MEGGFVGCYCEKGVGRVECDRVDFRWVNASSELCDFGAVGCCVEPD